MNEDPKARIASLIEVLPKLHSVCVDAATRHYNLFNRYPDQYPYTSDIEFAKNFSSLILPEADPNFDRLKVNVTVLLKLTELILSQCVVEKSKMAKLYFKQYQKEVVPFVNANPELYTAPPLSVITSRATRLASEWSQIVYERNTLMNDLSVGDISPSKITKISGIKERYDRIYNEYDLLNIDMAKYISLSRKSRWESIRNKVAVAALVVSVLSATVGVAWWKFGDILNGVLK